MSIQSETNLEKDESGHKPDTKVKLYIVEVSQALTALQLLDCPEEQIAILSICTLDTFVTKYGQNGLRHLQERDLLGKLFRNLQTYITTRPMCLKLLVKLSQVETIIPKIQETQSYIEVLLNIFLTSDNRLELEHVTHLLSSVCKLVSYAEKLCTKSIISKLFTTIDTSTDLDVQNNCLELLLCTVKCRNMAQMIADCPEFKVQTLNLILLGPVYILKLVTVKILQIISSWDCESLHDQLFESETITFLFDILSEDTWTPLQNEALVTIFNCIKQRPVQVKSLESNKFLLFVNTAKEAGPEHAVACMSLLNVLVHKEQNRQIMMNLGIHEILTEFCKFDNDQIYVKFCDTLAEFCKNYHVIKDLANKMVVNELKRLLRNSDLAWIPFRQAALQPLNLLLLNNPRLGLLYYETGILKHMMDALLHRDEMEQCYYIMALENFQIMLGSKCLQKYMWSKDIYNLFVTFLDDSNTDVAILAINVIKNSLYSQEHREYFLEMDGAENLIKMVCKRDCDYIHEALTLCKICVKFDDISKALLKGGIIPVIQDLGANSIRLKRICENIVDDIYNCEFSIKFHDKWFLDYHDTIRNGFCVYVGYKPRTFPPDEVQDIDDLFFSSTMITVNFHGNKRTLLPVTIAHHDSMATGSSQSASGNNVEHNDYSMEEEYIYKLLSPIPEKDPMTDYNLKIYLKQVRQLFNNDISDNLLTKIGTLANFVASRLDGYDAKIPTKYQYETHIFELKKKLQSNYIPLGLLRMGGMIERALLFKVLADRVNIPCTLRRISDYGAWNEVVIYGTTKSSSSITVSPSVIQYCIVDLMENIGTLLLQGEPTTELYCRKYEKYAHLFEVDIEVSSSGDISIQEE